MWIEKCETHKLIEKLELDIILIYVRYLNILYLLTLRSIYILPLINSKKKELLSYLRFEPSHINFKLVCFLTIPCINLISHPYKITSFSNLDVLGETSKYKLHLELPLSADQLLESNKSRNKM